MKIQRCIGSLHLWIRVQNVAIMVYCILVLCKQGGARLLLPSIDVDAQSLPPQWPPDPTSVVVDDATYHLFAVSLASIAMLTDLIIKVKFQSFLRTRL